MKLLKNRIQAGKLLAQKLLKYQNQQDVIVLALPRGGVPVGFQVAKILQVPLDIFLVRKLGAPGQEELAMGAIASGGIIVLNEDILQSLPISPEKIEEIRQQEFAVLQHRELLYRGTYPSPIIENKTVILVDDGIATGATMRAAIQALGKLRCKKKIVAIPVAPHETLEFLKNTVDEIYYLYTPSPFYAIGEWYQDFSQTSDEEVQNWLIQARNLKEIQDNKNA